MNTHSAPQENIGSASAKADTTLLPALGVAGLLFTPTAIVGAAILYFLLTATAAGAAEADPAGKKLFLKNKCAQCHTITALKILKDEDGGEEEELAEGEEKRDPPDLSGVGNEQKPEWMVKFLKKIEKLEGRKHKKKFKGSDEDLQAISDWLGTLKFDVPKDKGAAPKKK
jgi:mono/diheme cytochrome c family protein